MKRLNSAILTGTLLLGASLSVHAASILASGAVFGGGQSRVACEVFNANNTPITFISTQIFDQFTAGDVDLTFNDCGASLGKNSICSFLAPAANNQAFACKVIINQSKANVRGTMTALDSSDTAVSEADLR